MRLGTARVVQGLGALAMIVGPFLQWTEVPLGPGFPRKGTELEFGQFFTQSELTLSDSVFTSAGAAVVVLGLVALIGAALATRWPTRIAGLLTIAGVLPMTLDFMGDAGASIGIWLTLLGAIVAVVGSFLPTRTAGSPAG